MIKRLISLVLLAGCAYLVYQTWPEFKLVISNINPKYFLYISLLQVLVLVFTAKPYHCLYKKLGYHLRFQQWFGISVISNFINQLLPYRGGLAFRLIYMKQHYKATVLEISATTLMALGISALLSLAILALAAPFSLAYFDLPKLKVSTITVILTLLLLVVLGIGIIKFKDKFKASEKLLTNLFNVTTLLSLSLQNLVLRSLQMLCFYYAFQAFASNIPLPVLAVIVPLISLSSIFQLSPGNIGIAEGIAGLVSQAALGGFSVGFSAMACYRLSQLAVTCILSPYYSYKLLGHFSPKLQSQKQS